MQQTSLAAYDSVKQTLAHRQSEVLDVFERYLEGLALWQVAEILGRPMHTLSGRITELAEKNLIRRTEQRRVCPRSGHAGFVWVRWHSQIMQPEFPFAGAGD